MLMNRKKVIYIGMILILTVIVSITYFSYAFFTKKDEYHGKLNIVVGTLDYKIDSKFINSNNTVTLSANTVTDLDIKLTSLNDIDSKYELYYEADPSVTVSYYSNTSSYPGCQTGDINENKCTITAGGTKTINLFIKNTSRVKQTITFKVARGFSGKGLDFSNSARHISLIDNSDVVDCSPVILQGLAQLIYDNNTLVNANPTLTNAFSNTSDTAGLYASTDTNCGTPTYYLRGNVTNRTVEFAGFNWRVVRINEDGSVRLMLETAIVPQTTEFGGVRFVNDVRGVQNMYYSAGEASREAKYETDIWYDNNIGNNLSYAQYVDDGYFCEEARVAYSDEFKNNSGTDMTVYTNYTPTFKCKTDANVHGKLRNKIGLITLDEMLYAGSFYNVNNGNSNLYFGEIYWTMSPSGVNNSGNSYTWRHFSWDGIHTNDYAPSDESRSYPVINLKKDTPATYNSQTHHFIVN